MADLFAISDVKDEIFTHVIFLHGLGGHPYKTWRLLNDPDICWPKWLAQDIEGLAVWTVGYEASVSRWHGSAMHLTDRATNVLKRILLEPSLKNGNIVLVGHSMGGLVIKQLLRTAESMSHRDNDAAEFEKRVRKVAFIATPHSGADIAMWLANRLWGLLRPSAATVCLKRNDPYLRELNNWYREWSSKHSIEHLILTETQTTHSVFVVKPDSSDPGLLTSSIPIDAVHLTICKPKDRSSEIYLHVLDFIARPIETAHRDTVIEHTLKTQNRQLETLTEITCKSTAQVGSDLSALSQSISDNPEKTAGLVVDKILTERLFSQFSSQKKYPKELVDNEIEKSISVMRRSRFFNEFSVSEHAIRLANKIQNGEFEGGSDDVKCSALAWCARFLSYSENNDKSDDYIRHAVKLGNRIEIAVAEAFRTSANGNLETALGKLASIESPLARSAALFIVSHHNDAVAIIEWFTHSGIKLSDLDGEGKYFLLMKLFEIGHWDKAFEYTAEFCEKDYQQAPALFYATAMAHLAQAIPEELRQSFIHEVPFNKKSTRLGSDEASLNRRRKAQELLSKCTYAALDLGCEKFANFTDDYALWLELCDPEGKVSGCEKLQKSMREPKHCLRRLHFSLQFGLKLDLVAVEQEIERQTALSGGNSYDAALARFSFAFTIENPKDVVDYIERHRKQLQKHLGKTTVDIFEIEAFVRAGQLQQAEELLTKFSKDDLSDIQQTFLRRIIDEYKGDIDPIEACKSQFEKTNSIGDLVLLTDLLEEQGDWSQLSCFGSILFEKTKSLPDAERYARALSEAKRYSDLVVLLKKYPEFLSQSENLLMIWSWALYFEGLFAESAVALKTLRGKRDHPNDRALKVNLAIATGEWNTLLTYVEEEWGKREQRDAGNLIQTAQLAQHVGSPLAKELAHAATKDTDDPAILATAYFLATSAGWEDEATVAQWIQKAAELSDESGPLQKMSLKDLMDRKPGWDRREKETWQQLNEGTLPIFGAAASLNRSLVDMMLLPALANPLESDPRRRTLVPAYSGVRQACPCDYRVIAMEANALLTLGLLGLLDVTRDTFECIVIPHSTLGWLFEEKQKVAFHQPSKIKDAYQLRQLLADGVLKEFTASAVLDVDLANEVGEELASLIAEAQGSDIVEEKQRLVVRSSPVHRISSLMEEEADLSSYSATLCSCLSVVNKLKQKGLLTGAEELRARSYLAIQEKEWPLQAEISDGAVIYLDDLSVTYLQHTGVLGKLKFAGLETYVSARKIEEINALLRYEQLSTEVSKVIEGIRRFLAAGIQVGKIKVSRISQRDKAEEAILLDHPTLAIFELAKDVEAILVDDRFLNQHQNVDSGFGLTPILTTLDLLESLLLKEQVTFEQMLDCRTKLRQYGFLFIPVTQDELEYHLAAVGVIDGRLVESAELKAIRENLLRIRMSRFLQLPKEVPWFSNIMQVFSHTLKTQWRSGIDEVSARARSEWLLRQLDLRGWAQCYEGDGGMHIIEHGYCAQIMSLLLVPSDIAPDVKEQYWKWVETAIIAGLQEEEPALYSWLIKRAEELILHATEPSFAEGLNNGC